MATRGHFNVLWQPYEFLVIVGGWNCCLIAGTPMKAIKDSDKALGEAFRQTMPKERKNLDTLGVLYALMRDLLTEPRNETKGHIDNRADSAIFQSSPTASKNNELTAFICDYVRLMIIGNARNHEIEALMDEKPTISRMIK